MLFALGACAAAPRQENAWNTYKSRYIQNDGRVIDRHNSAVTHSEGIGYALYFAYRHDDTQTFERIFEWYRSNMHHNAQGLVGWKWGETPQGQWQMLSHNNATDGDLWIAYALLLMSQRTGNHTYAKEAQTLLSSIKQHLVRKAGTLSVLLPGIEGFETEQTLKLNPSYLLLEVFSYLSRIDGDPIWNALHGSALKLLEEARFSPLGLHSDWVLLDRSTQHFSLDPDAAYFGYDAIRVPLMIVRSDLSDERKRKLLEPYRRYLEMMRYATLGRAELNKGSLSLYDLSGAHLAVYAAVGRFLGMDTARFEAELSERMDGAHEDYYAFSLYLFTLS
ncbi:MAG: hypothetical protein JXK05_03695 [Campylobacterales bacterium]|nr:hypothetical protein [Campylobacterales bacterium]